MTKSAKRILIAVLSVLFLVSTAVFAAACDFAGVPDTDGAYTVTLDYDETQGSIGLDPDTYYYAYGQEVTATVTPNEGFTVDTFLFNGLERALTDENTFTFTVEGYVRLTVIFKAPIPKHNVSLDATENGSVELDYTGEVEEGTTVHGTLSPAEHYEVDQVLVNGVSVAVKDNKFEFTVEEDTVVKATFKKVAYNVELTHGDNGGIEFAEQYESFTFGDEVTVNFKPADHYEVDTVTVNGKSVEVTGNSYTFTVEGTTKIHVTFKATEYKVTLTHGDNGSIALDSEKTAFVYGEHVTVKFTPDTHYEIDTVTVNGTTVTATDNAYDLTVEGKTTVHVTFKKVAYAVTLTHGENGGIEFAKQYESFTFDDEVTVNFTPDTHYEVDQVLVNEKPVEVTGNSYTFTVEGTTKIHVTFKLTTHKVELSVEGDNGSAAFDEIASGDSVEYGTTVKGTVSPKPHYEAQVTVNGTPVEVNDNKFEFEVTEETTVVVTFTLVNYTVSVSQEGEGTVTFNPDLVEGKLPYGTSVEVTVTPKDGYEIESIIVNSDSKDFEGETFTFSFTVEGITTIEVVFAELPPTNVPAALLGTWNAQSGDKNAWDWTWQTIVISRDETVTFGGNAVTPSWGENSVTFTVNSKTVTLSPVEGYSDALKLTATSSQIGYVFKANASSSVTNFDALQGAYTGTINYAAGTVSIGADGIKINGEYVIVTASTATSYTFFWQGIQYTLTQSGVNLVLQNVGSQYFSGWVSVYATLTPKEEIVIGSDYQGTWYAPGCDLFEKIVVGDKTIKIGKNADDIDDIMDTIDNADIMESDGDYKFTYHDISFTMTTYGAPDGFVRVWYMEGWNTYNFYFAKKDAGASITFPEDFDGTWVGVDYKIVVDRADPDHNVITINDTQAFIYGVLVDGEDKITGLQIYYKGVPYNFNVIDASNATFKSENGDFNEELIKGSDEIVNEKFVGTWKSQSGDTNEYTIKIEADGTITINEDANVTVTSAPLAELLTISWNGWNFTIRILTFEDPNANPLNDNGQRTIEYIVNVSGSGESFYLFKEGVDAPYTQYGDNEDNAHFLGTWIDLQNSVYTVEISGTEFKVNGEQVFVYYYAKPYTSNTRTLNPKYYFFWHGISFTMSKPADPLYGESFTLSGNGITYLFDAEAEVAGVPSTYYGTWATDGEDPTRFTVEISAEGITIDGEAFTVTGSLGDIFNIRNADGSKTYTLEFDADEITYLLVKGAFDGRDHVFLWKDGKKSTTNPASIESAAAGLWKGPGFDVRIEGSTVTINGVRGEYFFRTRTQVEGSGGIGGIFGAQYVYTYYILLDGELYLIYFDNATGDTAVLSIRDAYSGNGYTLTYTEEEDPDFDADELRTYYSNKTFSGTADDGTKYTVKFNNGATQVTVTVVSSSGTKTYTEALDVVNYVEGYTALQFEFDMDGTRYYLRPVQDDLSLCAKSNDALIVGLSES